MDQKAKEKLKKVIDNCQKDDSILLVTKNTTAFIGTIRDIVSNIMFAKLQDDDLSKIIEILKKL